MRDYANILQLVILSNLENINAELINQGVAQGKRLERLNEIAKKQLETLKGSTSIKKILIWLADKSVDLAIAYLPIITNILNG